MKDFNDIKEHVIGKLKAQLPADLYYHNPNHTLDVLHAAELIGTSEDINEHDMILLKTAALYHDAGFIKTYLMHEEAGCAIAREELPGFGYNNADIDIICGLILATRIPQTPVTKLQEIIADADLDYLGRNDFDAISNTLCNEMKIYSGVKTDFQWNTIQVNFIQAHHYFTTFSKTNREPGKQKNLQQVIQQLNNSQ